MTTKPEYGVRPEWSLHSAYEDVRDFHRACDLPCTDAPRIAAHADVDLQWKLIDEEVNRELKRALDCTKAPFEGADVDLANVADVADAIADSIYVLLSTAATFGLPIAEIWRRVHESNMAKVRDGVVRRADGKILKPPGWTAPDVAGAIRDAMEGRR